MTTAAMLHAGPDLRFTWRPRGPGLADDPPVTLGSWSWSGGARWSGARFAARFNGYSVRVLVRYGSGSGVRSGSRSGRRSFYRSLSWLDAGGPP